MDSEESKDAELMRKALEGFGTDDSTLIEITAKRTHKQRMKIRQAYKSIYGRDLMEDLKSELSGNYLKTMLALFTDPIEYDVDNLKEAVKGYGTDEDCLIEILASRPGWYIDKIKKKYKEKYKIELEEDIRGDTSGNFQKLLISLIQGKRSTNQTPDKDECQKIANELYKAGEGKSGTDESIFNKYFAISSPHELLVIAREYHKLTGNLLTKAIDKEFSGDIQKLLKTILYVQISPSEYFASRIRDAVYGVGTNERILNRVIVNRSEIDLPIMKQYYKQLYGKDMIKDIEDDVSGDYKKLLLAICNQSLVNF
jgi:annexin A7/11